jgi:tyrosinase
MAIPGTVRKRGSFMSAVEQNRFINVMTQLINAPGDPNPLGVMVGHHADMSHNMHSMNAVGTQRFLPWHRIYLFKIEEMGQAVDPQFFIPYWRWTVQRQVPPWLANFKPSLKIPGPNITVIRNPGPPPSLPTVPQINAVLAQATYTGFTSALEFPPHGNVHMWCHGTMSLINVSPADPLFWLHHAQIDRLWSMWQAKPGNGGKNPTLAGANSVMDPWPETEVQARSIANLGYSYQSAPGP